MVSSLRRVLAPVLVVGLVVGLVAVAAGALAWRSGVNPFAHGCSLERADGSVVDVDAERVRNASLMAAVAQRSGVPARALTEAIATSSAQSTMELREAERAVGEAADGSHAQNDDDAPALASALRGDRPASLWCSVEPPEDSDQTEQSNGLTANAETMLGDLRAAFGELSTGGYAPGGVDSGHSQDSAHYDGRAVDVFFRPVDEESTTDGWALAHYAVANAERLEINTVIYDDRIWTASRSAAGWRDYDAPAGPNQATLRHLDHVHIDVA